MMKKMKKKNTNLKANKKWIIHWEKKEKIYKNRDKTQVL